MLLLAKFARMPGLGGRVGGTNQFRQWQDFWTIWSGNPSLIAQYFWGNEPLVLETNFSLGTILKSWYLVMLQQCTSAQNRPKSLYMSFVPMPILHIQCQFIKGSLPKTKRENVGIFPKSGTSLPLPPFLEPHVCEKKLCFFLHYRTLGIFLVFTKMLLSGWYYG